MSETPEQVVASLFTSKIFLTQVVGLAAMVATAAGAHVLDDPATQLEIVAAAQAICTALFRWLSPTGPVSLTAPLRRS